MMKNIGDFNPLTRYIFQTALICLLLVSSAEQLWAELRVAITPNPATLDDILELKLSIDTTDNFSTPEALTPFEKDFSIISGPSQRRSRHIINGKRSGLLEWSYQIQPKRIGKLLLPAFKTKSRTKIFISNSINVQVTKPKRNSQSKQNQWAFVEAKVNRSKVYLQEQITLNLKFFTRAEVEGNVKFPDLEKSFIMHNVTNQKKHYSTQLHGQVYRVNEFKILLFPKTTDVSEIPPIRLIGKAIIQRASFFDPGQVKAVNVGSETIPLEVLEPSKSWTRSGPWLPAAQVTVSEAWTPDINTKLVQGEPITRTITIKAQGQISDHLPSLPEQNINGIKLYPDKSSSNDEFNEVIGSIAQRVESIVYIPNQGGNIKLPSLEVPWFNTKSRKMEIAKLPPRTLKIQGGTTPSANQITPPKFEEITTSLDTPKSTSLKSDKTLKTPPQGGWMKAAGLFFILWIFTLIGFVIVLRKQLNPTKQITQKAATEEYKSPPKAKKLLKKLVNDIHKHPNTPRVWSKQLLTWASSLHEKEFQSLEAFINELTNSNLKQQLLEINSSLYGRKKDDEQLILSSKDLTSKLIAHQTSFERTVKQAKESDNKKGERLPPLYPQANS